VRRFATGIAVFRVAFLLTLLCHQAFAAGDDRLLDEAISHETKTRLSPASGVQPAGNDWDFVTPTQKSGRANRERVRGVSDEANASGATSADRVMYAICLVMAVSGLIAVAASWVCRRQSAGLRHSGGLAVEKCRLLNANFTHEEPFTNSEEQYPNAR